MMRWIHKIFLVFSFSFIGFANAWADEGMWLPHLLGKINTEAMKKNGLLIPVEKIYNENEASLEDAVVQFAGGCTGGVISDRGLVLTNHHCGFSYVQALTTVEKNYLRDGFWAMSDSEEIPCPGLTVTFIVQIKDVTSLVAGRLYDAMAETERDSVIKNIGDSLAREAVKGTHFTAFMRPFYNGNRFFIFVSEVFRDIRLVGVPPSAIGKFGGETDNWMWPRHNGDFALFRIYAGPGNKPASFSNENIPYKPRYHFPVSMRGVREGDFTMVYGFPGRTQSYLPSSGIDLIRDVLNPSRIKIRSARLELMEEGMKLSDTVQIKYAAKQRSLSNAFKKWQGELAGMKRLNLPDKKRIFEEQFNDWASKQPTGDNASLLNEFDKNNERLSPYAKAFEYYTEAIKGIELLSFAGSFTKPAEIRLLSKPDTTALKNEIAGLQKSASAFYKNFDLRLDRKVCAALFSLYYHDVDSQFHPPLFSSLIKKHHENFQALAEALYKKSVFADSLKTKAMLDQFAASGYKILNKDPLYLLASEFAVLHRQKILPLYSLLTGEINRLQRQYMAAQMEMQPGKNFYPDANLTLRLAYGNVSGYLPRDAVHFLYRTTLKGMMEKEDATDSEFEVPMLLKELFKQKNFGPYAEGEDLPLAFIATNHTTGGNSGSPVLNAKGELIGTNFDRVWEGTVSDLSYDPAMCRNISVDIRFTLFIIDKFAGCKRLIDEMTLVN